MKKLFACVFLSGIALAFCMEESPKALLSRTDSWEEFRDEYIDAKKSSSALDVRVSLRKMQKYAKKLYDQIYEEKFKAERRELLFPVPDLKEIKEAVEIPQVSDTIIEHKYLGKLKEQAQKLCYLINILYHFRDDLYEYKRTEIRELQLDAFWLREMGGGSDEEEINIQQKIDELVEQFPTKELSDSEL